MLKNFNKIQQNNSPKRIRLALCGPLEKRGINIICLLLDWDPMECLVYLGVCMDRFRLCLGCLQNLTWL